MTSSAVKFGMKHNSCALEWRKSLGSTATQADAWRRCHRGDWLIWQYRKLPVKLQREHAPTLMRAVYQIVNRAVRRGVKSIAGVTEPWATQYRRWARDFLFGADRTPKAAAEAWAAAAEARAGKAAAAARAAWVWEAWVWEAAWAGKAWAVAEVADLAVAVWAGKAWMTELRLQAQDIRREIPEWPGGES